MLKRSSDNRLNGGQVIVDYLIREKVPYAFGLCGHGNIQFIDALHERQSDIKTISVHHESVCGFMADAYYRVSGQPVATFTSCGPGSMNLPIALATAYLDSVPFLAVTGNVPTSQFGRGAFQELYRQHQADFPSTVRSVCKKVYQPTRGEQVPMMVRQAWKTMVTGRPGPVVLDVPFDVFMEAAAEETPKPEEWSANISSRCGADPDGVTKTVDMLLSAERPVILVGQGVKYGGATADLLALAEKLQIPVAHSMSGIGAIDTQHPLSLGLLSRGGAYQANGAARQADVLLALGVRFDDRTSSSWIPGYSFTIPPTRLIHVDIDPEEIGRNYPVALGLMAAKFAAPDRPCVSVCGDGAFFMHANVLGTAVEYNLPVVWVVWNNYAYASIRGLQRGYLGGRELATDFHDPTTGQRYNPDFAAMARSCGVEGVRIERAGDIGEAIRKGISVNKPYLIDVDIAADINPVGAGVWELPGLGQSKAGIGTRYQPA